MHRTLIPISIVAAALCGWQLTRHEERNEPRKEAIKALALPPLTAPPWLNGRRISVVAAPTGGVAFEEGAVSQGRFGYTIYADFTPQEGPNLLTNQGWTENTQAPPPQPQTLSGLLKKLPPKPTSSPKAVWPPGSAAAIGASFGVEWQVVPAEPPSEDTTSLAYAAQWGTLSVLAFGAAIRLWRRT